MNDGALFNAARTGLDHLAFSAASMTDLESWAARLERAGVEHSPIRRAGPGFMFDFEDPDGIQLEFHFTDPALPITFTT